MILFEISEIKGILEKSNIPFRENIPLAPLSSFKIGGISTLVIEPENTDHILIILELFQKLHTPFKILGGGTNLLISDHPDDFIVVRLSGEFKDFSMVDEGKFIIGSATNTTPTFRKISQMGFTGVEFLSTIPGWVGGAVIQNAGCYGGELFDFVEEVEFIREGKLIVKKQKDLDYGYRNTEFLKNKDSIITRVSMRLKKGNEEEIEISLKDKRDRRNSSQPENKKSAGSVFKNPKNIFGEDGKPVKAWQLIDQAGLRGKSQGGALISPEHCNFIVNTGNATASDVNTLVEMILEKVEKTSGITLEREIEYFGKIP